MQTLKLSIASLARSQIWYVPVLAGAMLLMMARPLLVARVFAAEEFAAYSLGLLISSTFCMLGCMGLQSILQRKMPMDFLSGDEKSAFVLLFQCIVIAFICLLVTFIVPVIGYSAVGLSATGILLALIHGLSQQIFLLVATESRSRVESLRFSKQNLARAVMVFTAAGVVAFYSQSAVAVLLIEAVISFLISFYILGHSLARANFPWMELFKSAVFNLAALPWRSAMAFLGVMFVGFFLFNADRWLAASVLSSESFAVYAFGWVLLAAAQSVQVIINSSVYPHAARLYSGKGESATFRFICVLAGGGLLAGIMAAWPAHYLIGALVSKWFPEYEEIALLMPYFILAGILRVGDFWSSYLMIVGKESLLLKVNILAAVAGVVAWWVLVQWLLPSRDTIVAVAYLALILSLVKYMFVFIWSIRCRRG